MRTLRLSLAGMVILAMLGATGSAMLAHEEQPVGAVGPLEPDGPSIFTLRQVGIEDEYWPPWTPRPDGSAEVPFTQDIWAVESSDPRLSGTLTRDLTGRLWPLNEDEGVHAVVMAGAVRIDNEDGTWRGTHSGHSGLDDAGFYHLQGEGTYAGLTTVFHWVEGGAREGDYESFSGIVFPGPMPGFPDNPELPAE
jgi:hypothetical protein